MMKSVQYLIRKNNIEQLVLVDKHAKMTVNDEKMTIQDFDEKI